MFMKAIHEWKKGRIETFGTHKLKSKLCLVYLEVKLQERYWRLTYLQIKMPQYKPYNVFRSKETTIKVPLMFLDVKKVKES